ncbi:MAG: SDR family oxidoreductase [Planctomycetes bacterium]|nr:SDR family oxidoreductase [Planctomycetota bacterium]
MTDQDLTGRHALVCGASSGIGRAAAVALAEQGATVTALARRAEALEGLVGELFERGLQARALVADLEDHDGLRAAVRGLVAEHGAVHVLLNNTGGPPAGPLLEAEGADFERAFKRHVLAAHLLVRELLPGMREAHYGRILNVISTSVREPIPNLGVSNTIRGAMASWAKSLSKELPPGITINSILPGFVDTQRLGSLAAAIAERGGTSAEAVRERWLGMVPEGRLGRPEELGGVIAFLASPAGAYVRGVCLPVDGGRLNSI